MESKLLQYLHQNNHIFGRLYSACKNSKNDENLAAVLCKEKELKIETRPIPKINSDQVLVQIETVGIGALDIRLFKKPAINNTPLSKPIVMGHEASGIILECGECIDHLKPGDKVALEPQIGCQRCHACKSGHCNICKNLKFFGLPPLDGVLCRYYACQAENCHKLPCSLNFEDGSLLQPLSVVMHACKRAKLTAGDALLVSCANITGLLSLLAAKSCGVTKIIVADNNEYNLKKAKELGSTCVIKLEEMKPTTIQEKFQELIGRLPNKTLDCSGNEEIITTCIHGTKSGGRATLVGFDKDTMCLPMTECIIREVDIVGSKKSCNDYPKSISVLNSGAFDPKVLVTHHFKLEDTGKAFDLACNKEQPFLKIMIHCDPKWEKQC